RTLWVGREDFMKKHRIWVWIIVAIFLSSCAATQNWTRRETVTATAAAACGIIGGNISGWVNHNNGHPLNEGKAIPAGFFGGALLCGGPAFLHPADPPPPPPKPTPPPAPPPPPPPASATSEACAATTAATGAEGRADDHPG